MSIEVEKVDALRKGFEAMVTRPDALNVGDIVIMHPDLPGGFKFPNADQPAIIVEWLARPFYGHEKIDTVRETGTPQSAMRFDCIILVLEEDGDKTPWLFDSRRLKKIG